MWRVAFSGAFIVYLFINMFWKDKVDVLKPNNKCLRDYTFIWTEKINQFLIDDVSFRDKYIIFCSTLMDIMFLSFFFMFWKHWRTYRIALAYPIFFGTRAFI